jgi:hypothetical protein
MIWSIFQPFLAEYVRVEAPFSGMLSMHEQVYLLYKYNSTDTACFTSTTVQILPGGPL